MDHSLNFYFVTLFSNLYFVIFVFVIFILFFNLSLLHSLSTHSEKIFKNNNYLRESALSAVRIRSSVNTTIARSYTIPFLTLCAPLLFTPPYHFQNSIHKDIEQPRNSAFLPELSLNLKLAILFISFSPCTPYYLHKNF